MTNSTLSSNLNTFRITAGLTQENVASSLGVSNKTISKWETGASEPDITSLITLSKLYNVSVDTLLGLGDPSPESITDQVAAILNGSDYEETVQKTFEILSAVIPAEFPGLAGNASKAVIPKQITRAPRSEINTASMYHYFTNSDDVNMAVMLYGNKSNFAWLADREKQHEICSLLRFLSDENTLEIYRFIHQSSCSDTFTAGYISDNTGIDTQTVSRILDASCELGTCSKITAHLENGDVVIYQSFGNGKLLSIITLAYDELFGNNNYNYNLGGKCKLIRGTQK